MKKIDVKSLVLGLVIGSVGITAVFAATGNHSTAVSDIQGILNGQSVPQVSVQKALGSNSTASAYAINKSEYLTDSGESITTVNSTDNSSGGNIDLIKKEKMKRILETDIGSMLSSFDGIDQARVILSSTDDTICPVAASIVLTTNKDVSTKVTDAIVNSIVNSVKGLEKEYVEIIDQNGKSIYSGLSE